MGERRHRQLIEAARKFVGLFDNPEPGMMSWHMMVEEAFKELAKEVEIEQSHRPARSK